MAAEDEKQLFVTIELPRSNFSSELPTPPQSHINTPQVPNSRTAFENDHELSILCDKMDSLTEGIQDVLTNKQHKENKNTNTLHENKDNLQKQLLKKDEIIRSLIETQTSVVKILKSQKINQKLQNEIQKVQNGTTNRPVIFPE